VVDRRKHNLGFAATETLLATVLFLGVFVAVLEVGMLCVRGELMSYATTRAARLASVYRNEYSYLEAGSILPTIDVHDLANDNVAVRELSTSYKVFPITRVNVFRNIDEVESHARAIPTLPDDITDEMLRGDNPLPYCIHNSTEISPCDPD